LFTSYRAPERSMTTREVSATYPKPQTLLPS